MYPVYDFPSEMYVNEAGDNSLQNGKNKFRLSENSQPVQVPLVRMNKLLQINCLILHLYSKQEQQSNLFSLMKMGIEIFTLICHHTTNACYHFIKCRSFRRTHPPDTQLHSSRPSMVFSHYRYKSKELWKLRKWKGNIFSYTVF